MPLAITDIRERTEFLEKSTRYVFSMDLRLAIDARADQSAITGRLRAELAPRQDGSGADTYHVLNEELTTTVDGVVHELPLLRVDDLQDWLTIGTGGVIALDGRCRLMSDDGATISMGYGGVIRLEISGGQKLLTSDAAIDGSAQITAQFESDRPRYRWLTQAQFIGFGAATLESTAAAIGRNATRRQLTISIDFYSAM